MDDHRLTDAEDAILLRAAKWAWLHAPHEKQREALEHVTRDQEIIDVAMAFLIRSRRDEQAERN